MSAPSAMKSTPSSSSSAFQCARIDNLRASRSEYQSVVEFEMVASTTSHWTQLDLDNEPVCSPEDNLQHFESLQLQYQWAFLHRASLDKRNLVVGKNITNGGHAKIYEATIEGGDPVPLVVKVFKEGYFVFSLEQQWPQHMLAHYTLEAHQNSLFRLYKSLVSHRRGALAER